MHPTRFPQANRVLAAPPGMDDCSALHVWTDDEHCVSRWKPSLRERLRLIFGGSLWLWVRSGRTQPPVALSTDDPWRPAASEWVGEVGRAVDRHQVAS